MKTTLITLFMFICLISLSYAIVGPKQPVNINGYQLYTTASSTDGAIERSGLGQLGPADCALNTHNDQSAKFKPHLPPEGVESTPSGIEAATATSINNL
ncbi:MAG: hypothetical protein ISR65_05860 [Bacteriovoracaceae bacterium]|nr:hypothetical protein [Bacteriovoracaceae bacterium]